MPRVIRKAAVDDTARQRSLDALRHLGVEPDATVRFRREEGGHWLTGRAIGVEADGSLGLSDARGRRRSIPIGDVEVQRRGPRGGLIWVPLADVAATEEQLGLF